MQKNESVLSYLRGFNSYHARGDFCRQLITYAYSLATERRRQSTKSTDDKKH